MEEFTEQLETTEVVSDVETTESAETTENTEEVNPEVEHIEEETTENTEEQEQTGISEDNDDNKEDKQSTFEVPDFVPDEYLPKEFDNEEEELDWYRENYIKLIDIHKSDNFVNYITDLYSKQLEDTEKKTIEQLINENNIYDLKTKYPQFFQKLGHNPTISEEEKQDMVYNALSKEFGIDYEERYNVEDAENPDTLSGKMIQRQREILAKIEEDNNKLSSYKPMSEEDLLVELNNQYDRDFKPHGIDKNKYVETIEFAKEKGSNLSVLDFYRIQHFNDYVNDAYQKGMTDGKKQLTNEFKQSGRKIVHSEVENDDNELKDYNKLYKNEFIF